MDYKALKWSVHDNPNNPGEPCIGVITLNRPEKAQRRRSAHAPGARCLVQRDRAQLHRQGRDLDRRRAGLLRRRRSQIRRRRARRLRRLHGHHRSVQGDGRVFFQRPAPPSFAERHAQARRFAASDDRRHQRPRRRRRTRDGDALRYAHRLGPRALRRSGRARPASCPKAAARAICPS